MTPEKKAHAQTAEIQAWLRELQSLRGYAERDVSFRGASAGGILLARQNALRPEGNRTTEGGNFRLSGEEYGTALRLREAPGYMALHTVEQPRTFFDGHVTSDGIPLRAHPERIVEADISLYHDLAFDGDGILESITSILADSAPSATSMHMADIRKVDGRWQIRERIAGVYLYYRSEPFSVAEESPVPDIEPMPMPMPMPMMGGASSSGGSSSSGNPPPPPPPPPSGSSASSSSSSSSSSGGPPPKTAITQIGDTFRMWCCTEAPAPVFRASFSFHSGGSFPVPVEFLLCVEDYEPVAVCLHDEPGCASVSVEHDCLFVAGSRQRCTVTVEGTPRSPWNGDRWKRATAEQAQRNAAFYSKAHDTNA